MCSEAKVTEIYCMADDFYKEYVCKHLIVYCYNSLSPYAELIFISHCSHPYSETTMYRAFQGER